MLAIMAPPLAVPSPLGRRGAVSLRPAGVADAEAIVAVRRTAILRGSCSNYDARQRLAWAGPDGPAAVMAMRRRLADPAWLVLVAAVAAETVGVKTLSATARSCRTSCARYTVAMPPRPSSRPMR